MTGERPTTRVRITATYDDLSEPVEGELKRERIPDADAKCPHCGNREWLLIEKRAEPEEPFTRWRALACSQCELSDGWRAGGRRRPGRKEDDWAGGHDHRPDALPEHPTAHDVARIAPFAVFAPSDSPTLRSTSYMRGQLIGVTVADGGLEVTTEVRQQILHSLPFESGTPERRARQQLRQLLTDRAAIMRRQLSKPAEELAFAEHARDTTAEAEAADASEMTVEIDSAPHMFSVVEAAAHWAAAAHMGEETVTVSGQGAAPGQLALHILRHSAEP